MSRAARSRFLPCSALLAACVALNGDPSVLGVSDAPATHEAGPGGIEFVIVNATSGRHEPDVELLVVGPTVALRAVGHTDQHGRFFVANDVLEATGDGAILFCKAGYQCSAVRLDTGELTGFEEYTVALTGIILR
jgi:hypothetical protein